MASTEPIALRLPEQGAAKHHSAQFPLITRPYGQSGIDWFPLIRQRTSGLSPNTRTRKGLGLFFHPYHNGFAHIAGSWQVVEGVIVARNVLELAPPIINHPADIADLGRSRRQQMVDQTRLAAPTINLRESSEKFVISTFDQISSKAYIAWNSRSAVKPARWRLRLREVPLGVDSSPTVSQTVLCCS